MKKPELLAPGGSFAAACQAFEAGADGVYLGLSEFSARKAATNFTLEQLRRILGLARGLGRKIHVTLNTVIRQEEMGRIGETLAWLEALRVDAVIVQDPGMCLLIAQRYPGLAVHASTQMAIHNDSGLRFAEAQGIKRVILSRELPLERIRELRARHPGIEMEVFIHGALCYSFSGVCLASWALTGRSGNRGDCAQICRSVFSCGQEGEANPFSCRDLSLGTEALKLAEIGIDSLKIEGRMKSPEYVYHVTKLYREILDRGDSIPAEELQELQRKADVTFSRERTKGFFHSARGERLLTERYQGHQGVPVGTVREVRGREIGMRLLWQLSLHDGAGYWLPGSREPVIFPVRAITLKGKQVRYAGAGENVFIPVGAGVEVPAPGTEVSLFSSRFLDRPQPKEASVPLFRVPIPLVVMLSERAGQGILECSAESAGSSFSFSHNLPILPSTGRKSFEAALRKSLEESGGAVAAPNGLRFENRTGKADDEIFVPPSEMKKARNSLFAALDSWLMETIEKKSRPAVPADIPHTQSHLSDLQVQELSDRAALSPPGARPIPFASLADLRAGPSGLASLHGFAFLPLPPVILNDREWLDALVALSESHPETRFAIGLANVGHLDLAARLADRQNCFFFIDFYLYAANAWAVSLFSTLAPRLLFAYSWIEGDAQPAVGPVRVIPIAAGFRPPLFYSLGCYERHVKGRGHCPEGCPRDSVYEMRQGRNRFQAVVRDCITYLFQEAAHGRVF